MTNDFAGSFGNERQMLSRLLISSALTITALIGCGLAPMAFAQDVDAQGGGDAGQAILVLDASGSMWGKLGDKHKVEIAREVIADTVQTWNPDTELGLLSYGHRRAGDCADIELLLSPAPVDATAFTSTVNAINPKGKTPLSAAVIMAAEQMQYTEKRSTVILVTDGKETCDLDPCAVGQSLEEAGIDFTAHVIGFDVAQEDSIDLRCLASETGGAYIDAKDSEQLAVALGQTRDVVTDTAEVKRSLASINVPTEVFAGASFEARWTGPKNASDYLVVRQEGEDRDLGVAYIGAAETQSPTPLVAPEEAGRYRVHYSLKDGSSLASDDLIVITPDASVDAPDTVIAGAEFSVSWTGPGNRFDFLRMYDLDGEPMHEFEGLADMDGEPVSLTAPSQIGEYQIRYRTGGRAVLASDNFTVIEALATVNAPSSVKAGAPYQVEWTGPQNRADRLRILDSSGKRLNNYKFVHKDNVPNPIEMIAPEELGDNFIAYDLKSDEIITQQPLTVLPVSGTLTGPAVVAPNATYEVFWEGPNYKGTSIYTYSSDGKDIRRYKILGKANSQSPVTLKAPEQPGTYELRYRMRGRTVIAKHSFEVR